MTDFCLNRPSGSLNLTSRWDGKRVTETREWVNDRIVEIDMMQDVCPTDCPIRLKVRKFRPRLDDRINRQWYDETTETVREEQLEPYSLANVEEAIADFSRYIYNNAIHAILNYAHEPGLEVFFKEHYLFALSHFQSEVRLLSF